MRLATAQRSEFRLVGPRMVRALPLGPRCLGASRTAAPAGQKPSRLAPRPWGVPSRQQRAAAAAPRLPPLAAAASSSPMEVLLDALPGKDELLTPRLDPEVRQRAERAITQRGGRVTIGDVASTAGLRLEQAEEAVRALAADSQAALQVAEDGEIVWVFPRGFQDTIRSKSWWLRAEPGLKAVKAGAEYLLRVAFGTALIASVAVVFAAITVIASSGRDDRGDRRGGGGGYYGGGPRFFFNLTDLLWYWDPYWHRNRQQRMQQEGGMNFLEAIFSWVFGDGDPNGEFDRKRWEAVGRYIQSRGGTVVAEELAPFLDLKPGELAADRGRITVDESYMLPVLGRFNGSPEVDAAGNIVYSFPQLQQTATAAARAAPPKAAAVEQRWQLTAAGAGQKLGAVALGALNLVGVVVLSAMLADPMNRLALARNGLAGVAAFMPFLQAYAAAFFAIPAVRSVLNAGRNAAIDSRNDARKEAAALLARPDPTLGAKLAGAAQQAKRRVITDRDIVYRSDQPLEQQPRDLEADAFEERLRLRERERQRQAGGAPPERQQRPPGQDDDPLWWQQQQQQRQRDRR